VTQYDVELFQRVEHFLGKKLEAKGVKITGARRVHSHGATPIAGWFNMEL